MSDLGSTAFSEIDASNNQTPPNGWPGGMNPSDVEPTARAGMGAMKRFYGKANPVYTTGGTATAYTLTSTNPETAYYNGQLYSFVVNQTCGTTPTLNIDAINAYNLRKFTAGAWATLAAGDIKQNQIVTARYNSAATTFDIVNVSINPGDYVIASAANTFTGIQTFSNSLVMNAASIFEAQGPNLASASTVNIGSSPGNFVQITGAATITAFDTVQNGVRKVVEFLGVATLVHNASVLYLPTQANITTAFGDVAQFHSLGGGAWICTAYMRSSGLPLVTDPAAAPTTNSLAADVNMTSSGTFYDGPSVNAGSTGTWFASGTVTVLNANQGDNFIAKLWDGTNVRGSTAFYCQGPATPAGLSVALSGYFVSPAGNIRISVNCTNNTTAKIKANQSGIGNSDSTITAFRIV